MNPNIYVFNTSYVVLYRLRECSRRHSVGNVASPDPSAGAPTGTAGGTIVTAEIVTAADSGPGVTTETTAAGNAAGTAAGATTGTGTWSESGLAGKTLAGTNVSGVSAAPAAPSPVWWTAPRGGGEETSACAMVTGTESPDGTANEMVMVGGTLAGRSPAGRDPGNAARPLSVMTERNPLRMPVQSHRWK